MRKAIVTDLGRLEPDAPEPVAPLFDCGYAPGIYFGMAEDDYHAIPALSATGIKNLMVSPMDFWARSWMNPWREEDIEETEAKAIGKAYHKRILEGKEAFDDAYAPYFECDNPDSLRTTEDLKEALKDLGQKIGGNKPELIERLLLADPAAVIFDVLEKDYREQHEGKEFLSDKMIRKIELSARMIECHHALKYCFVGGYPEVTVIWFDAESGIWFKARFDYLKVNAVNDLKTFANMNGKTIEKAVYGEMASRKYHIQAALYMNAAEIAKTFVREDKVHTLTPVDPAWLKAFAKAPEHVFNFVFQQKGPAPVSVGAIFDRRDQMTCAMTGKVVTSETQKKTYVNGTKHQWTYLRCGNPYNPAKKLWVKEEVVLEQVEDVFRRLQIDPVVYDDIVRYVKNTCHTEQDFIQRQTEELQREYKTLQGRMEKMMDLVIDGVIEQGDFERRKGDLRLRQREIETQLRTNREGDDGFQDTLLVLLSLAKRAHEIFKGSTAEKKRQFINLVFSNLQLKGETLCYSLKKPFDNFIECSTIEEWRLRDDSNIRPSV